VRFHDLLGEVIQGGRCDLVTLLGVLDRSLLFQLVLLFAA
jgi:hypothetical protein